MDVPDEKGSGVQGKQLNRKVLILKDVKRIENA